MAELHDEERDAIRSMMDIAEVLDSGEWPGLREWQRLSFLPPPAINGNHICVKPRGK